MLASYAAEVLPALEDLLKESIFTDGVGQDGILRGVGNPAGR
jgi:hypothetical protein